MIAERLIGIVVLVLVFCVLGLLCIAAFADGDDWDDDKGKGE